MSNPQAHNAFTSLGSLRGDAYNVSENCLGKTLPSIYFVVNSRLLHLQRYSRTFYGTWQWRILL